MSNRLVTAHELSRIIAKQIDANFGTQVSEHQGFMQKTVLKVVTTFTKFVSHHFKKENKGLYIADVPIIGQFVCFRQEEDKPQYEFIPSNQMQVDCLLPKRQLPVELNAGEAHRKELTIGKIAEVSQLGFDQAQQILNLLVKQIVSCLIICFIERTLVYRQRKSNWEGRWL